MLDAVASGLPIVVSDRMGDMDRVEGNGLVYSEGRAEDMARALRELLPQEFRTRLGAAGRRKVEERLSWKVLAVKRLLEY